MTPKRQKNNLPTFDELIIPTVKALIKLGGSGTVDEINTKVFEIEGIPEEILAIPHSLNDNRGEIEYRLAWSRTYLKKSGLVENSNRGIWALSKADIDIKNINVTEIKRAAREQSKPVEKKLLTVTNKQVEDDIEEELKTQKIGKVIY